MEPLQNRVTTEMPLRAEVEGLGRQGIHPVDDDERADRLPLPARGQRTAHIKAMYVKRA
jgi:hypothetical protein